MSTVTKAYGNDFGVHDSEKFAEWRDAALLHQISNLIGCSAGSGVRNGPRRFFARLKLGLLKDFDEDGEQIRINHRLNLLPVTCGTAKREMCTEMEGIQDVMGQKNYSSTLLNI